MMNEEVKFGLENGSRFFSPMRTTIGKENQLNGKEHHRLFTMSSGYWTSYFSHKHTGDLMTVSRPSGPRADCGLRQWLSWFLGIENLPSVFMYWKNKKAL